ncbi:MAG: ABC transporter family substrate-binding protein [Micrococcales bacterium]|nr:ABC transporter family substrate-binding protein [Micrococcales bacterium]
MTGIARCATADGLHRPPRPLGPSAVACLLTLALLAACATGSEAVDAPDNPAPGPQNASEASQLVSTNPQPRESLAPGRGLTLPVADLTTQWNLFNVDGADADTGYIISATDPELYVYAADGAVSARPEFLTALPTETTRDGKQVLTYRLNPEATWNDGTPIDYRAFEAVRKVNARPMQTGRYDNVSTVGYEDIESVTAGSAPGEVVVTFDAGHPFHPATELFTTLLHPAAAASPEVFNKGFVNNFHPEWRAGPFTLGSIDTTAKTLTLVRNPRWWGHPPLLEEITFRQMEDSTTIAAFKNGEVDAVPLSNGTRYAQIQGSPDLDIRRSQKLSTGVLIFNSSAPPLSDISVRKAMWQAIDREQWKLVRYKGMNWSEKPVNSALYYSFQPQARDNMPVTHSLAGAKRTLEAAGYRLGDDGVYAKDGRRLSIRFTYFGDEPLMTALGQTVATQAAAAGIDVQLDNRPSGSFNAAMKIRDFTVVAMGWQSSTPSPITSVCQVMCTDGQGNLSATGTPALDRRIRALGAIADPIRQSAEINAIEKEWLAFYGQMPLTNGPDIWAYRRGVANLGPAVFAGLHPIWEDVGWMRSNATP